MSNNRLYDLKGKVYSKVSGSVILDVAGPKTTFANRTSVLFSHGFVDLYTSASCLYEDEFCSEGFSFAFWLKIESIASNVASYYLSGGERNQGFSVYSPLESGRNLTELKKIDCCFSAKYTLIEPFVWSFYIKI